MAPQSVDVFSVKTLIILGCVAELQVSATGQDILNSGHKHRTSKAAERAHELWCYRCHTLDINNDYCINVNSSQSIKHKCDEDRRTCMVKRISFTTSTENTTSVPKLWSLERNCSQKCEPGCIVIGERLKLYRCTSCCDSGDFCNHGSGGSHIHTPRPMLAFITFNLLLKWSITSVLTAT